MRQNKTVNQPSYDFEGSSPSSPTNHFNNKIRWLSRPAESGAGGHFPRQVLESTDRQQEARGGVCRVRAASAPDCPFKRASEPRRAGKPGDHGLGWAGWGQTRRAGNRGWRPPLAGGGTGSAPAIHGMRGLRRFVMSPLGQCSFSTPSGRPAISQPQPE